MYDAVLAETVTIRGDAADEKIFTWFGRYLTS
jgi:hypothetical protein